MKSNIINVESDEMDDEIFLKTITRYMDDLENPFHSIKDVDDDVVYNEEFWRVIDEVSNGL